VDGIDIRKIDLGYYRSQIGYVQQESMMFRDTILKISMRGFMRTVRAIDRRCFSPPERPTPRSPSIAS